MDQAPIDPTQVFYGLIAICGGIARYLKSYVDGAPFSLGIFAASAFISGFGGWVFAQIGISMNLPQPILYAMAGAGGYFSDQTLKLVLEYVQGKAKV
jgi:hypothetical protein